MNSEITTRLQQLRNDYTKITGVPCIHFYCPMLFRDEDAPLCKAHVVNQAFGDSSRAWTVQRKDVDNFYGSKFESDFTVLQHRDALGNKDVLGDRTLRQKLRPKILVDDREVSFFIPNGEIADHLTAVTSSDEALPAVIGLKLNREEMLAVEESDWVIEISLDLGVQSLVALIKAAYLTNVHVFGYRYVLSAAGHCIGHDLLGRFFEANAAKSREDPIEQAKGHFAGFVNMVRPVVDNRFGFKGTVTDNTVLVCWARRGYPWATVVFVRTGRLLHAVMMPISDHLESIPTYLSFLANDNQSRAMKVGRFECNDNGYFWRFSSDH